MKIIDDTHEKQPQTATVNYVAPRPINLGDVFYTVEKVKTEDFREPCRVCGGKLELTVNGVTFRCPCCGNGKEVISIHIYAVRRYRIYRIEDEIGTLDWKLSDRHTVEFSAYRKVGSGYNSWSGISFADYNFCRRYNKPFVSGGDNDGIYDNYKTALSIAEQMNEEEINRLIAYNAEHGTNYTADFTPKHDPKSN